MDRVSLILTKLQYYTIRPDKGNTFILRKNPNISAIALTVRAILSGQVFGPPVKQKTSVDLKEVSPGEVQITYKSGNLGLNQAFE